MMVFIDNMENIVKVLKGYKSGRCVNFCMRFFRVTNKIAQIGFWPLLALVGIVFPIIYFVPNSYWFEVQRVFVHDAIEGEIPKVSYERRVNHDFDGAWSVIVKKVQTQSNGLYDIVCEATGPAIGRVNSFVPTNLNLASWTNNRMCKLDKGDYEVDTVWRFRGFLFERKVEYKSNVFKVYSKNEFPPNYFGNEQ